MLEICAFEKVRSDDYLSKEVTFAIYGDGSEQVFLSKDGVCISLNSFVVTSGSTELFTFFTFVFDYDSWGSYDSYTEMFMFNFLRAFFGLHSIGKLFDSSSFISVILLSARMGYDYGAEFWL